MRRAAHRHHQGEASRCSTLKISKDMFYRLVAEFPQMAIEIMRELAHRVEDTNEKLREATANKAA